jgi:hypothetical protein
MMDDPREILKAAGVECAEVEDWLLAVTRLVKLDKADAAILALARLVAKQAHELKQENTFIELLKGMVEQMEDEKHEGFGYDLGELQKRVRDA